MPIYQHNTQQTSGTFDGTKCFLEECYSPPPQTASCVINSQTSFGNSHTHTHTNKKKTNISGTRGSHIMKALVALLLVTVAFSMENCGTSIQVTSNSSYDINGCGCTSMVTLVAHEGVANVSIHSTRSLISFVSSVQFMRDVQLTISDVLCSGGVTPLLDVMAASNLSDFRVTLANATLLDWAGSTSLLTLRFGGEARNIIIEARGCVTSNVTVALLSLLPTSEKSTVDFVSIAIRDTRLDVTIPLVVHPDPLKDSEIESKQWCFVGIGRGRRYFGGLRHVSNVNVTVERSSMTCTQTVVLAPKTVALGNSTQCSTDVYGSLKECNIAAVMLRTASTVGHWENIQFQSIHTQWEVRSVATDDLKACPASVTARIWAISSDLVIRIGEPVDYTIIDNVIIVLLGNSYLLAGPSGCTVFSIENANTTNIQFSSQDEVSVFTAIGDIHPLSGTRASAFFYMVGVSLVLSRIAAKNVSVRIVIVSGVALSSRYHLPPAENAVYAVASSIVFIHDLLNESTILMEKCNLRCTVINGTFGRRISTADFGWKLLTGLVLSGALVLSESSRSIAMDSTITILNTDVNLVSSLSVTADIQIAMNNDFVLGLIGASYNLQSAVALIMMNCSATNVVVSKCTIVTATPAEAMIPYVALPPLRVANAIVYNSTGIVVILDSLLVASSRFTRFAMPSSPDNLDGNVPSWSTLSATQCSISILSCQAFTQMLVSDGPCISAIIWMPGITTTTQITITNSTLATIGSSAPTALASWPYNTTFLFSDSQLDVKDANVSQVAVAPWLLRCGSPLEYGSLLTVVGSSMTFSNIALQASQNASLGFLFSRYVELGDGSTLVFENGTTLSGYEYVFESNVSGSGGAAVFVDCGMQWNRRQPDERTFNREVLHAPAEMVVTVSNCSVVAPSIPSMLSPAPINVASDAFTTFIGFGASVAGSAASSGDLQLLSSLLMSSCPFSNNGEGGYSRFLLSPFIDLGWAQSVAATSGTFLLLVGGYTAVVVVASKRIATKNAKGGCRDDERKEADELKEFFSASTSNKKERRRLHSKPIVTAAKSVRFPAIPIAITYFILPGLTRGVSSLFFGDLDSYMTAGGRARQHQYESVELTANTSRGAGDIASGVFGLSVISLMMFAIYWFTWKWIFNAESVHFMKYFAHDMEKVFGQRFAALPAAVRGVLLPKGQWAPHAQRKYVGVLVNSTRGDVSMRWMVSFATPALTVTTNIVSAIIFPPDYCWVQRCALGALYLMYIVFLVGTLPFRSVLFDVLALLSSILMTLMMLCGVLMSLGALSQGVGATAMSVLSFLVTMMSLIRLMYNLWLRFFVEKRHKNKTGAKEKQLDGVAAYMEREEEAVLAQQYDIKPQRRGASHPSELTLGIPMTESFRVEEMDISGTLNLMSRPRDVFPTLHHLCGDEFRNSSIAASRSTLLRFLPLTNNVSFAVGGDAEDRVRNTSMLSAEANNPMLAVCDSLCPPEEKLEMMVAEICVQSRAKRVGGGGMKPKHK